jgi:hypothetical protein
MRIHYIALLAIAFTSSSHYPTAVSALLEPEFKQFFPQYNTGFQRILRENCSEQLAAHHVDKQQNEDEDEDEDTDDRVITLGGDFEVDSTTHLVVDCILQATPELIKSKMASAQVLFGLMPSLLALLGPAPHQTGFIAIVAGRPLLALLLAAGSPAVSVIPSVDHVKDVKEIHERRIHYPGFFKRFNPVIVGLEYVLALVSIANVAELSYRLGVQAVFTFSPNGGWVVFLWAFLGITIHILCAVAVYLRVKLFPLRPSKAKSSSSWLARIHALRHQNTLELRLLGETFLFNVLSWVSSIYTVCHIFYGTLLFSSILFISLSDVIKVVLRFMASTVVCRLILKYELSSLQGIFSIVKENQQDGDGNVPISMDRPLASRVTVL